jgi:hypothetical protein
VVVVAVRSVLAMVVLAAVDVVLMCETRLVGRRDDHPQPARASIVATAAALLHLPSMFRLFHVSCTLLDTRDVSTAATPSTSINLPS